MNSYPSLSPHARTRYSPKPPSERRRRRRRLGGGRGAGAVQKRGSGEREGDV